MWGGDNTNREMGVQPLTLLSGCQGIVSSLESAIALFASLIMSHRRRMISGVKCLDITFNTFKKDADHIGRLFFDFYNIYVSVSRTLSLCSTGRCMSEYLCGLLF